MREAYHKRERERQREIGREKEIRDKQTDSERSTAYLKQRGRKF